MCIGLSAVCIFLVFQAHHCLVVKTDGVCFNNVQLQDGVVFCFYICFWCCYHLLIEETPAACILAYSKQHYMLDNAGITAKLVAEAACQTLTNESEKPFKIASSHSRLYSCCQECVLPLLKTQILKVLDMCRFSMFLSLVVASFVITVEQGVKGSNLVCPLK